MSYPMAYRPYFYLLLIFGLFPYEVRSTTKKIHLSRLALVYTILLFVSHLSLTIMLFVWRIQTTQHILLHQIRKMANLMQGAFCALLHFILIVSCWFNCPNHVTLLNDLVDFDRKIQFTLKVLTIDRRPHFVRATILKHLFVVVGIYSLNGYIDSIVNELPRLWYNVIWIRTANVMIAFPCLMLMHIRYLSLMLTQRYAFICHQLINSHDHTVVCKLFGLLQHLAGLQNDLQKCFGLYIMLNIIFDLVMLTVTMYMTFIFALGTNRTESFALTPLMFLLPIVKQTFFIWVMDDFGKQVNARSQ